MEKIQSLSFRQLWNSEHPLVYNRLAAIVESHQPEQLHLSNALGRVNTHLPLLAKIEAQERGSSLSKSLQNTDMRRDSFISAITGTVRAHSAADIPDKRADVEYAANWLNKHNVGTLSAANYTSETERLADMLAEITRDTRLKTALDALYLTTYADELAKINAEFEQLFVQRSKELASIEPVDSRSIRDAADADMRKLFSLIELYQEEYPDVDYIPLVRELNSLLGYYKAQLSARAGRRKSGANIENETPIAEPSAE